MKRYILPVFSAMFAFACQPSTPSRTQGTVSDGESYRWKSRTIAVCWENPADDTAAMQKVVEDIVGTEYGQLDFRFTGWQACEEASPGIRIRIADSDDRHVLAFGARLDGMQDGMQLNLKFQDVPFYGCNGTGVKQCVEEDALHEFGHALGLRHEQSRTDSFCGSDGTVGLGEAGAWNLTAYDKDSIMNYCANDLHILLAGHRPKLSAMDLETLRTYYASAESVGRDACEANGLQWFEDDLGSCCAGAAMDQLSAFGARPYHDCRREYQMNLNQLDDAGLRAFLGSSYETMKNTSDADENGPWLNVELACRYQNFRKFAWDFYLWGDELREFIKTRSFSVRLKPAADLICEDLSLESSEAKAQYLKGSFKVAPSFEQATGIEGIFAAASSPAYDNFPVKYIDIQLPELTFKPLSVLMSCDRNSFIGYASDTKGLMGVALRYNANYADRETLHCTGLQAFDTELPREATQSHTFPNFSYEAKLNATWDQIGVLK